MTMFIGIQRNDKLIIGADSAVCVGDGVTNKRLREDYFDKLFTAHGMLFFIGGRVDFSKRVKDFIFHDSITLDELQAFCNKTCKELNITDEIQEVSVWLNECGEMTHYSLNSSKDGSFTPYRNVIKEDAELLTRGFKSEEALSKACNKYYKTSAKDGKIYPYEVIKETFDEIACPEVGGVCKLVIMECRNETGVNINEHFYLIKDKYNVADKETLMSSLNKYLDERRF